MALTGGKNTIASLLSCNGGFMDMVGFIGMQALLPSLITGNFLALGATLFLGGHGVLAKLIAVPLFIAVVAMTRIGGRMLERRGKAELRVLLAAELAFLTGCAVLAIGHGALHGPETALTRRRR